MDDTAPEATYSTASEFNAVTSITCSLNKFSGTEYAAISTNDRWFDGFATEVISTSNGTFHTNSLAVKGDIFVTWTGGAPTALQIWPGAIMQHSDGSEASPSPVTDPCTLTVSQKAGGTWQEIWSGSIARAYWTTPQTKDIDIVITGGTTEFKFNFSKRTVIRGLTLIGQGARQVFKDDNIAAGTITGIQERLTVGDTGMDCRVMDLFQQRLVMASSDNLPFSMWFSNVGDLYNFYANRPQTDSDAFSVTIPATKASKILHIVSGKWLTLFTESGEYVCDPGAEGLSYRSISIKQVSSVGIHPNVEPIQTEDRMVFVAHDGRSVYEMRYDLQQDSVIPVDRSILAYHLTEGATIIKAAYQRFPDSVIWFLLSDGTLLSLTFTPDQDVIAWARHTIGQPAGFTGTLKLVNIFALGSVRTSSGSETTSDIMLQFEVFSGTTRQASTYIERMRPNICTDSPSASAARCSDHIGIPNPPAVSAKVVTLRPESPDFNTMGLPKNVQDVTLRVRRTHTISVKPVDASLSALTKVAGSSGTDTATLFSGDVKIAPKGYINGNGQLEIASTNALPCELLSMVCSLEVSQ
jgi:hypothetical protein